LRSLGLGKDTANSWKTDISHALNAKVSGYASVNDARRNTVWGDESVPNLLTQPPVIDNNQPAQRGTLLGRSMSTRSPGLRVEIAPGMDSARTSVATMVDIGGLLPPPSAASTVTLFDPIDEFDPQLQSTPYDAKKEYPYSRKYQAAAMARSQYIPASKRSSIVYIKSSHDHVETPTDPEPERSTEQNDVSTPPRTLAQWSSRAVRPLIPKSDKQRKDATEPAMKSGSLRSLSLLKDRDSNQDSTGDVASAGFAGTRPLVLGKKKPKVVKENVAPSARSGNKYLKPLQLGRTDSSKVRGMLRMDEALPSVIVRPPSDRMDSIFEVR
jgi:hypothetical protein